MHLTTRGEALYRRLLLAHATLPRPRRWDAQWRVVVFDIREDRKLTREAVRKDLRRLGFLRLQDSVWVYPHDCSEAIELLRRVYRLEDEIFMLHVSRMDGDALLRRRFDISSGK
jgi:CRISPR-associated endonuclease Cas2